MWALGPELSKDTTLPRQKGWPWPCCLERSASCKYLHICSHCKSNLGLNGYAKFCEPRSLPHDQYRWHIIILLLLTKCTLSFPQPTVHEESGGLFSRISLFRNSFTNIVTFLRRPFRRPRPPVSRSHSTSVDFVSSISSISEHPEDLPGDWYRLGLRRE